MKRRSFLKSAAGYTAMYSTALGAGFTFSEANALSSERILVNVMLLGGADYRYLLAPAPDSAYADTYWSARKSLYQSSTEDMTNYPTYQRVWDNLYAPVEKNGAVFGIHQSAGWLRAQFDQGNVAIISNVVGSTNRRHDHSQLIMHAGDVTTGQFDTARDGWGGRLANAIGNANIISAARSVPVFCNSENLGNRNENVVHVRDSRDYALAGEDGTFDSSQSVVARALEDYYSARGQQIESEIDSGDLAETWAFRRFFQHEKTLRTFGEALKERLAATGPRPAALSNLMAGSGALHNTNFGLQCANLYDCLMAQDVLQLRAAYLEYPDWDTHTEQKLRIERHFEDVFGSEGGLSALTQEMLGLTGVSDNTAFVFTTDFGRQLAANRSGTDHGRGNYMLLVGNPVQGGIYGDMFPAREIMPDDDGEIPFQKQGADIKGETSFERVLAEACNWVEPASGSAIFPQANSSILEPGVDLTQLFS